MVLCYGGNQGREVYEWNQDRFDSYVTYVDEVGKEQWLFDAFLCLEFEDRDVSTGTRYSLMAGQVDGPSGSKTNWEHMLDYWYMKDNGLDALDKSIEAAKGRIGEPVTRRQVVLFLPDPIPFLNYRDSSSTQIYWGELDGRQLDFSKNEDRMAAYRWYIDESERRFAEAGYRNIDLAGYYVISECIAIPSEPWTDFAKLHDVIPPLAECVHSLDKALYWIPFSQGAGWRRGRELGFDYVWMQPNHFWRGDDCPMSRYKQFLRDEGCGMEFEFDTKVYERNPEHEMYRERFREYMECAVSEGIYGSQPLTYYIDSNCVYDLRRSEAESDRAFYHEFCKFVVGNPLRNI